MYNYVFKIITVDEVCAVTHFGYDQRDFLYIETQDLIYMYIYSCLYMNMYLYPVSNVQFNIPLLQHKKTLDIITLKINLYYNRILAK